MKKRLLTLITILLPFAASAYDAKIDGIYYYLKSDSKEAEVTDGPIKYSGSVDIPATVIYDDVEYKVTTIKEYTFWECSKLTSVSIPNSVNTIKPFAFGNCSLTSITIPNSVKAIEYRAFYYCESLVSITLPESMTSIGDGVFVGCSSLTSITIPNGITSIGDDTFWACFSLSSVTIPNSVTTIGEYSFVDCRSLTFISIPNSVTSIGRSAFSFCKSLTTIIIGNSVNKIDNDAFEYCSALTDVYCLAESVPSTNGNAFNGSSVENATLHVPANSVEAYKAAEPWKNFKDIVAWDGQSIETLEYTSPSNRIDVYSIDGKLIGSNTDQNGVASIVNNLSSGTTVIVRMGEKSVKLVVGR
ncbi:MAG: leucine-rich repeat domain-containing protein [Bacteroidales bacterium]|nr:leucine-rich repeat domain-containing protein [Bacteroidales bacterium]